MARLPLTPGQYFRRCREAGNWTLRELAENLATGSGRLFNPEARLRDIEADRPGETFEVVQLISRRRLLPGFDQRTFLTLCAATCRADGEEAA